jgi:TonB C terminal
VVLLVYCVKALPIRMCFRFCLPLVVLLLPFFCLFVAVAETKTADKPAIVDWAPYMKRLQLHVKKYWMPPDSRTATNVVAAWKIRPDGTVSDIKIKTHGASKHDDGAVIKAIQAASPFEPLPKGAEKLDLELNFDCNGRPKPLGLTVDQALAKFGPDAKKRLLPCFQRAKVKYPPQQISLICFKDDGRLFLFAKGEDGKQKQITSYQIVSNSGVQGPKLKEGDLQVPEGFYKITRLDAMTHMAMWVNYPNPSDGANAKTDRRTDLGGNIQIHGGVYSTGCLVITNDDMAELLVLGHAIGCKNIELIVAPCNLLVKKPEVDFGKQPKWLPNLYKELKRALAAFPIELTGFAH